MGKPEMLRLYEPDEDQVHFQPFYICDGVTLCGVTDTIGRSDMVKTKKPVTCAACIDIVRFVHDHRKPRLPLTTRTNTNV